MTKHEHKVAMVRTLREILAKPNARIAAQHELYLIKASLLTKRK